MTTVFPIREFNRPGLVTKVCLHLLQIAIVCLRIAIGIADEAGRKTPVPARSGRQSPRVGSRDDAAGAGSRHQVGAEDFDEPELSVADRKRGPAAPDQYHEAAAGQVLQGASGISGG